MITLFIPESRNLDLLLIVIRFCTPIPLGGVMLLLLMISIILLMSYFKLVATRP